MPPIASVLPGYEGLNFHGMHAPAKTPAAIVARLHDETTAILRSPEIVKLLNSLAMDIVAGTPEQYRRVHQGADRTMGSRDQVLRLARRLNPAVA